MSFESDCCGASTSDPEMGICPDCLEHCEFENLDDQPMCANCGEVEVESFGQPCSQECRSEYVSDWLTER